MNFSFDTKKINAENISPENCNDLQIVLTRFIILFNLGMYKIINKNSNQENILKTQIIQNNYFVGNNNYNIYNFFELFLFEIFNYGTCFFYRNYNNNYKLEFKILNFKNLNFVYNKNFNSLNSNNFIDRFEKIYYKDGKNNFELNKDYLYCYIDCYNYIDNIFLSRFQQKAQNILNLAYYKNIGFINNFNRISYGYITKKATETKAISTIGEVISGIKNKLFQKQNSIKDGGLRYSESPLEFVNTSIPVRNLGFDMADNYIYSSFCNILGVQREILSSEGTTYNNQSGAKKDSITAVMAFADKLEIFFSDILIKNYVLDENEKINIDYSQVLEINLAENTQDINNLDE